MDRRPFEGIIVLGAPRSGTTLMRRLLDAHPDIACPGETHIFNACARFLHSEPMADGADIGVRTGLNFAGFPDAEVLDRLREFAFAFPREYAHRQGKRLWAEKSAYDAFFVREIEALCGDRVAFICINRHGLDVASSLSGLVQENGFYPERIHTYVRATIEPMAAFCRAWVDVTTEINGFAARHPDNAILYRYEDLVRDPEATLRRLFDFVGAPWDATLIERAMQRTENVGLGDWKTYRKSAIDSKGVGRWQSWPRSVTNRMAAIVNPTLVASGYDQVATEEDVDAATARRRYELGLLVQAARSQGSDTPR